MANGNSKRSELKNGGKATPEQVEAAAVVQQTEKKRDAQISAAEEIAKAKQLVDGEAAIKALETILEGASPDDAAAIKAALLRWKKLDAQMPISPDDELVEDGAFHLGCDHALPDEIVQALHVVIEIGGNGFRRA